MQEIGRILELSWKDLRRKSVPRQAFYQLLAVVFICCRKVQKGVDSPAEWSQSHFVSLFLDAADYDLKESVLRFSEEIDWAALEAEEEQKRALSQLEYWCMLLLKEEEKYGLNQLIGEILDLAASESIYSDTPESIRKLLTELFRNHPVESMGDFCSGAGLLGMELWKEAFSGKEEIAYCGIDENETYCDLNRIFSFLQGVSRAEIIQKDLRLPPSGEPGKRFDFIVMDMPRGANLCEYYRADDVRIPGFDKKKIYTDWLLMEDVLYHLKENGYAAVLATTGALIRSNEKLLRRQVIVRDWLEAVITLPANLYHDSGIAAELLIFHKNKKHGFQEKIWFLDISSRFAADKKGRCRVSEEGIELAVKGWKNQTELPGVSRLIERGEIDSDTYSLKPLHYVASERECWERDALLLSEVAELKRGAQVLTKKNGSMEGEACFINVKDIQQGRILYETAERISEGHPAFRDKFRIQEDDILITSKGTILKMAVVEKEPPLAFITGNITLIRVDASRYNAYVLLSYLDSKEGRMALEKIQSGTTIRILNNSNLSKLRVPKISLDRQEAIGRALKNGRENYWMERKRLEQSYTEETDHLIQLLKEEGEV